MVRVFDCGRGGEWVGDCGGGFVGGFWGGRRWMGGIGG